MSRQSGITATGVRSILHTWRRHYIVFLVQPVQHFHHQAVLAPVDFLEAEVSLVAAVVAVVAAAGKLSGTINT